MSPRIAAWTLALGVLCGQVSVAPAAEPAPLEVGAAVTDITPTEGQTHDPLLAKALFFRQGECQAALVVCDQAAAGLLKELKHLRRTKLPCRRQLNTGIPISGSEPLYRGSASG